MKDEDLEVNLFLFKFMYLNQNMFPLGKDISIDENEAIIVISKNIKSINDTLLFKNDDNRYIREFCNIVLKGKCTVYIEFDGNIVITDTFVERPIHPETLILNVKINDK